MHYTDYSTVHSTVQYSAQYSTVQYSTIQYSTIQYSTVQNSIDKVELELPFQLKLKAQTCPGGPRLHPPPPTHHNWRTKGIRAV